MDTVCIFRTKGNQNSFYWLINALFAWNAALKITDYFYKT